MRLGQIARKLDITPAELGAFLQSQLGVEEWGTNSRLSEEQLTRVLHHFAPDQADRFFQISKVDEPELPATPEPAAPVTPVPESRPAEPPEARPEGVEVIKAARVELSGLKVLGKIELPEKKKKEPAGDQPEKGAEAGSQPARPPRHRPQARDERPQAQKNPIALQREREAREALRKKQEETQRQKEKKANRYFKAIQQKPVKVTRAARMVQEELEVVNPEPEMPAPKTWWGRFLRWLNT